MDEVISTTERPPVFPADNTPPDCRENVVKLVAMRTRDKAAQPPQLVAVTLRGPHWRSSHVHVEVGGEQFALNAHQLVAAINAVAHTGAKPQQAFQPREGGHGQGH